MAVKSDAVSSNLAAAIKGYAEAFREALRTGKRPPEALPNGSAVTQTDVMIAVDSLLRAADIEIFEIQIWRSLGRGSVPESSREGWEL